MAYNPTPNDPSPPEDTVNPDEQPTIRGYTADEAPTIRRAAPQQRPSPPQQQGGTLPSEQAGYPAGQPGGYPAYPQPGYPTPQQESYAPPQQENYPLRQPTSPFYQPQGGYPPVQQGSYPPTQQAGYPPAPTQQAGYPPAQQGYPVPPGATGAGQQPAGAGQPPYSQYAYQQQVQPQAAALGVPRAAARFDAQRFWRELTLLGQVAGIAGLVLLIFFFLPWSYTPDIRTAITQPTGTIGTINHSGWSSAVGLPLNGGNILFNLFPHLWLVLVSALALIVIAVLLGVHRITLRLAAILISIISLFALLLEILFLVQMNSVQGAVNEQLGGQLNQTLYGVSWGFWIALIATIVALGVGAYMLYREFVPQARQTPQAPRFPGGQQPYPTA